MVDTTIRVSSQNFPLHEGEVLKIKNAGGRPGLWRVYVVGTPRSLPKHGPITYRATMLAGAEVNAARPGVPTTDYEAYRHDVLMGLRAT